MEKIKEGLGEFIEFVERIPSKRQKVFFNPLKKLDRDISVIVYDSFFKREFSFLDLLAASGIRGIRVLLETKSNYAVFNDINKNAIELIKKNIELNKINKKYKILNLDSRVLPIVLSENFDCIDIDPFGSPIPFLYYLPEIFPKSLLVSVTSTDIGVLAGKYKNKALLFYDAQVFKTPFMHEVGIRVLINKVFKIFASYGYLSIPIFSHASMHYYRVYFHVKRVGFGKIYKYYRENFGYIDFKENYSVEIKSLEDKGNLGILYLGNLWNYELIEKVIKEFYKRDYLRENSLEKYLYLIKNECKVNVPFFYNIHYITSYYKIAKTKKLDEIIEELKSLGYKASRTHFLNYGIRTNAPIEKILETIKID